MSMDEKVMRSRRNGQPASARWGMKAARIGRTFAGMWVNTIVLRPKRAARGAGQLERAASVRVPEEDCSTV